MFTIRFIKNSQRFSESNLLNSKKKNYFRDLQWLVYFLYIGRFIIAIPEDN